MANYCVIIQWYRMLQYIMAEVSSPRGGDGDRARVRERARVGAILIARASDEVCVCVCACERTTLMFDVELLSDGSLGLRSSYSPNQTIIVETIGIRMSYGRFNITWCYRSWNCRSRLFVICVSRKHPRAPGTLGASYRTRVRGRERTGKLPRARGLFSSPSRAHSASSRVACWRPPASQILMFDC